MSRIIKYFLIILLINACQSSKDQENIYPRMIGDIAHDSTIDSLDFKLCNDENKVVQYYAATSYWTEKTYRGEKHTIDQIFKSAYNSNTAKKESGLIRIRFIVNCHGETGRFRIIGMDEEYKEKTFDKSITDQLLSITKKLEGWKGFKTKRADRDYYQYLIFKLKNGELIETLP